MHEPKSSDYDKLKQIFNNTEASADEQKRIKMAFVEGYESGLQRQMRGRTIWLKIMQNIVIVSAIMFIIWAYRTYENLLHVFTITTFLPLQVFVLVKLLRS